MNTFYQKKLMAAAIIATISAQFAGAQELPSQTKKDPIIIRGQKIAAPNVDGESKAGAVSSISDTASLLQDIPGMSLYKAGGLSSLPALHGFVF